ncbi:hypothetical protein ACFWIJ_30720 [Streptomyces sp. NPDC127079]|uniref:hypothetical protein n=1 Tax=Streptomyces sp. NPDC127079 TaxID=3347132 RepID=UPI00365333C9
MTGGVQVLLGERRPVPALAPRYEQLSSCLRELAHLRAERRQGAGGLPAALTVLAGAGRTAGASRAALTRSPEAP